MELITRKCRGCSATYRCLHTSKQLFHADYCEEIHAGNAGPKPLRIPNHAELHYIETGRRIEPEKRSFIDGLSKFLKLDENLLTK